MEEITIVGVDLAKNVFQIHAANAEGRAIVRKRLPRTRFLAFMSALAPCIVAMEACATSHYWAREVSALGHDVRLIPPIYVKPFVKRQKNDANDAEAITEAALRPSMRTVAVKSPEQQALAMLFRTRELLLVQKTQLVNALRLTSQNMGSSCQEDAVLLPPSSRPWKTRRRFPMSCARRVPFIWTGSLGPLAKSRAWKSRSMRIHASMTQCSACAPSPVSDRLLPWLSKLLLLQWRALRAVETSQHGSGLSLGNIPAAANSASGRHRRWGNETFADC